MTKTPKDALTAAINKALASGAPLYVEINSFQHWAMQFARAHDYTVKIIGNWVELTKGDDSVQCMTEAGVKALIDKA